MTFFVGVLKMIGLAMLFGSGSVLSGIAAVEYYGWWIKRRRARRDRRYVEVYLRSIEPSMPPLTTKED